MKIGLIDVDSHNFPNLCLMKLSEYHTRRGDRVEWWSPKGRYDLVYKSRVFTDTYSKDTIVVNNAEKVIQGGTGYGPGGKDLPYEIEHIRPDYFLYPRFLGTAYGFLSRGCPRNCGFCIVSGKEGRRSVKVADLSEFWRGEDEIKLLDPNLLACPDHEALLEQLAASRALVDFTQGLDIRLTNPDNIALLNRVRTKAVHFAWDNPEEDLTEHFKRFVAHTAIRSDRNRRVYVLTNYGSTHEQDLYRVNTLRALGYDPYVMIYERPTAPKITRHLQRWVNNKRIFHTVKDFKDYAPMKKGGALIGLCNDPEGPEQGTEQGPVRADQTAGDLFRSGSNYRRAAFLFDQGGTWHHHGGPVHDPGDASLLPVRHVREERAAPGGVPGTSH